MAGQRWWIVDEVARWWRTAPQEARWLLMQRAIEGTKDATLEEVQAGAIRAELADNDSPEIAPIIQAWASGKGFSRR